MAYEGKKGYDVDVCMLRVPMCLSMYGYVCTRVYVSAYVYVGCVSVHARIYVRRCAVAIVCRLRPCCSGVVTL
jgi:hypothetical protein